LIPARVLLTGQDERLSHVVFDFPLRALLQLTRNNTSNLRRNLYSPRESRQGV